MADRFEDHRGIIQDLLGPIDCVTSILTYKGAIRGNHYHRLTTQWTIILSGKLLVVTEKDGARVEHVYGTGDMCCDPPSTPHAWKALEDTEVLVFTRGPRSGEDYETDTYREGVSLL